MDGSGGNAWLPPEGMHAAASLFSLIAESELKCNDSGLLPVPLPNNFLSFGTIFIFKSIYELQFYSYSGICVSYN